jgi:hypothetical protein
VTEHGSDSRTPLRRFGRGRSEDTPLLALGAVALAVGTVVAVVVLTALLVWAFAR